MGADRMVTIIPLFILPLQKRLQQLIKPEPSSKRWLIDPCCSNKSSVSRFFAGTHNESRVPL